MIEEGKKVNCQCDRLILSDERYFGLGFMCIKCGLNADERYDEYVKYLNHGRTPLTDIQRKEIRRLIVSKLNEKWRAAS